MRILIRETWKDESREWAVISEEEFRKIFPEIHPRTMLYGEESVEFTKDNHHIRIEKE